MQVATGISGIKGCPWKPVYVVGRLRYLFVFVSVKLSTKTIILACGLGGAAALICDGQGGHLCAHLSY